MNILRIQLLAVAESYFIGGGVKWKVLKKILYAITENKIV